MMQAKQIKVEGADQGELARKAMQARRAAQEAEDRMRAAEAEVKRLHEVARMAEEEARLRAEPVHRVKGELLFFVY
jgi:hypothetical protein